MFPVLWRDVKKKQNEERKNPTADVHAVLCCYNKSAPALIETSPTVLTFRWAHGRPGARQGRCSLGVRCFRGSASWPLIAALVQWWKVVLFQPFWSLASPFWKSSLQITALPVCCLELQEPAAACSCDCCPDRQCQNPSPRDFVSPWTLRPALRWRVCSCFWEVGYMHGMETLSLAKHKRQKTLKKTSLMALNSAARKIIRFLERWLNFQPAF